jgi:hypothetical protein
MTPQEHYDEAGELANRAAMAANDAAFRIYIARATLHARLALAGFTRDAAMKREDYTGWKAATHPDAGEWT